MKIIMSATDCFWTTKMKCMESHLENTILLQHEKTEKNQNAAVLIDVRSDFQGLGHDLGSGRESRSYFTVKKHIREIIEKIDIQEDVLVLADTNPQNIYIFDILGNVTDRNFNLHFGGFLPLHFESQWRSRSYRELLSGVGRIKSLFIKNTDDYLKIIDKETTMLQLYEIIQADLENLFPRLVKEIMSFEAGKSYFFDGKSGRYIEAELSDRKWIRENISDEQYMVTEEKVGVKAAVKASVFAEERQAIEQISGRSDGKEICRQLKSIRKSFAEANNITFESGDCEFEGDCAGTCEKCDAELAYLNEQLDHFMGATPRYPFFELPDCRKDNERKLTADHILGFLIKTNNEEA